MGYRDRIGEGRGTAFRDVDLCLVGRLADAPREGSGEARRCVFRDDEVGRRRNPVGFLHFERVVLAIARVDRITASQGAHCQDVNPAGVGGGVVWHQLDQ